MRFTINRCLYPFTVTIALLFIFLPAGIEAQIVDNAPAVDLIGQYDSASFPSQILAYGKSGANDGPNRLGLNGTDSLAMDTVHHRLFLADSDNHRILVFNLTANNLLADKIPDYVLGQPDFNSASPGTTDSKLNNNNGVAYDPVDDRLYASDAGNHRVLVFDVTTITNGEPAILVLGQSDFITNTYATSETKMFSPYGIALDVVGRRLFVPETGNSRVLVFDNISGLTSGQAASHVLGQANFTNTGGATMQNRMAGPYAVTLNDSGDRLYVADTSNNRVLVFDVAAITDGENAINVLGQSDFTTNSSGTNTATSIRGPRGVALDSTGNRLFVAENVGGRMVVHDVSSITDGQAAMAVLGKPDFTTNNSNPPSKDINTISGPYQVLFQPDSQLLYVGDVGSQRVLIFDVASITNGENAVDLIGQYDGSSPASTVPLYTKSGSQNSPNLTGIDTPGAVEVDAVHHRLFVADTNNNRVLVFNLTESNLLVDHVPDAVLGQPDFMSKGNTVNIATTVAPKGLAYDAAGDRLFVGTTNRILVFDTATISNGEDAVAVLGQSDFTSNVSATTQTSLKAVLGLTLDSSNRLYAADSTNNRVMIFDVASITNGEPAVAVLGQTLYTTSTPATTQTGMNTPWDVAVDSAANRLYVGESGSRRVLVFDTTSISDGASAVNVLGQADFTSSSNTFSQAGGGSVRGVDIDPAGKRLFVTAQASGSRILVYDVNSITDGEDAVNVYGQTSFTSTLSGASQQKLFGPSSGAYDPVAERYYVADTNSHRVMFFPTAFALTYDTSIFEESNANDGSISTVVTGTLPNATFAALGVLTPNTHYTVANIPAGLTAVVTATSSSTVTVALSGNAASHVSSDDRSNVTITFLDAAFSGVPAANISGSTKSDFAIDFQDAPTPTPTNTPVNTPADTPVAPTAIPTSVPTAGPTPAPTVAATATAGPSGTPTPSPTEIRGQVFRDGQPLAGAIVYIAGLGVTTTDTTGTFVIAGANPNTTYTVFIQRSGVLFPAESYAVGAGQFVQILGATHVFNPNACVENDISETLVKAGALAGKLKTQVTDSFALLRGNANQRGASRALKQLTSYLDSSRRIPDIILKCTDLSGCSRAGLATIKTRLALQLDNLRHEALRVNATLRKAGIRKVKRADAFARAVTRANRSAKKLVRGIPRKSDRCS